LTEIFSINYLHSKVQDLMVGSRKTSFYFDHWPTWAPMSISTYFRPNNHQNGPEILGVNNVFHKYLSDVHGVVVAPKKNQSYILISFCIF
jgi:hypothetical protein